MSSWEEYKKKKYAQREEDKKKYQDREEQRQQAKKNAEIQQRKIELSNKKNKTSNFIGNSETKQYVNAQPILNNSTVSNVNKKFQELIQNKQTESKTVVNTNKLFQNEKGLNISLSEDTNKLKNPGNADAKLGQEELDRLAKLDRKGRVEALKGRSEKTLQEAELYSLSKRNEETEKKVNEAKGVNKFLAANEYLAKEFAENTVSSFGQIKATADRIQGRDKDLSGLEYAQKYQEAISPLGQNVNSRFLQNLGIAAEGVGQQTPQILLGTTGAGALVGGFTEFANTYNEMTLEDPNNKTKTMITALLKGTVAGGLESALGLFGGGKLDKLSKSQLAGIKNKLVRNVMATGYDVAGEITEEQLENMIGYVIDKAVNDKNITMEQAIKEAEATFKQTSLTTLLMSALGLGGNTRREVNSIAERTNWVNQLNVTSPQKTELRRLAQDENITNEELYNQVMKIEQENAYQDTVYENIIKNAESTKKQQATIENKEVLNQSQQTTLKQGEMAQKQASSQLLGNEKYTIKMPNSNYKFVKSGDEKIDNFRQDVSQNWNNSKDTQKLVSTIETIMKDKGVAVRLDANITDEAGNILDGKYENGVITINPNSTKTFEYVATHELTHAIGTKEMLNMVQKYRESNKEFNSKLETILKNYNKSELTEEALADVSAELFGTQEFIANVKNTNPNLFQKIYNEIKYLWHQFRGYKNQNQFVEDLYNKWTKAYNSKAELNQTTKYSLAGEKALFADFSKLEKAKEMLKDNKDLDDIWIKTGWTKGDDGKWRFEIDDNKFDIKENSLTPDTEKPLHEILDAEELYDNYPELADINVITTKLEDGVNGSYERLGNVIYLSNDLISTTTQNKNYKFVGLHNQHKAFVSLLHEIQHYIQKQEGFARGGNVDEMRSAKNSKLRKLGERIDTLTAQYNKEIEEYRNSIHYNETVEELFKIDNPDERSEALYNYRESVKATPRYKEIEKIDDRIKELESEFYELEDISPFQLYKRLGGEQESSWVETRIETPSEKRKNKRPQYTNENTIFAETDDLMYNKQQRGNDDAIQLGNNLSTTSQSGQESGTPRRGGTDSRQSIETSSNGEIHRSIKGNNIVKGNNIQRSEGAVGHIDRGLEESSSFLMQDNKGRTLSKEQQAYFKDSKVRDDNGNLLEMYHGSPNGEFTVFRDNSYFSANEEYAKGYENTWASSSGVMKETKNPKTYKVYLNITNPFTLSNPKAKEIYLKEYIKGGNSAYYDPYTDYTEDINNLDEVDWVEGEDLIDWLKENHPEFDGILFDEGGDGGYGEAEYRWRGKSFVPFNANQIKNVDNLNPTENPDIRYSKQNAEWYDYVQSTFKTEGTRTYKEQLIGLPKETDMPESMSLKLNRYKTENEELKQRKNSIENMDIFDMSSEDWIAYTNELNNINDREAVLNSKIEELENIPDTLNNIVRNRKENKTFKEKTKESNAKFQKAFVNKYYEIDEIAKKTNNKKLTIALDNWIGATQQVGTSIDGNIKRGTGQTNSKGEVIGESITEILKDVYRKKDISNLTDYMQNKLNIERSARGKANLSITPEQSMLIVERYEKQKPYFKDVAEKMYKFYDNILQNCVDAGLGTEELKNAVREMYPSYFPIYKNMTELTSFIDSGEINNKMIKRAVGGQTDILAIDVASAEYVMGMNKKIQLNNLLVELKNSLEKSNQLEDYVNTELPADADDFAAEKPKKANEMIMQTTDGDKIATCYIDGVAHQFKISNEIYELLKPQDIKESAFGSNIITAANNLYRKMVTTYNPFFTLRNMVKDFQNGCYNTKYGALKYTKNYLKGIKEIFLNGEMNRLYKNVGLQGDTKYTKTQGILADNELNVFQRYNPINLGNKVIDYVNSNIEMMGRMSEFISAIESGKDINEARYEASEITLNFKRGGEVSKTITRWGGTFFNSSVLAVDKTIKNITGKNGKKGLANFVTMGLVSGVAMSLINHLVYEDDEEYEQLPDYIKDGYWLIKKNDGSGTFYRIAKDQITTAIGSTARRIYQMAEGEEDIGELADMFTAIFENLGVENPITSNMYAPIVQAATGETWYGEELLSDYQKTLSPELQYDYRTNEISKAVAEGMTKLPEGVKNIAKGTPGVAQVYDILSSPKKSDYVLQQYLGGVGKVILPAVTPYAEQNYVEKEMTTNSVLKSKYPSMVYDEFDKAEMEFNSYGTNQDRYLYLTEAKKQLGDYYKEIREVENDNTLSNDEKREREYEIKKELNKAAKDILDNLENTQKTSETSKIGEKEYYKDTEGKWKTVSEEDKIEGISTDTYAKYKNELKIATEKKREEEDDEEATLDKKEKVAIINSSNYTAEEKKAMYEKSYGNQDSTYKNLSKITDVNIEAYLNYIQEEIKGDDDPNSTKKGKTISGSKKKNLLKYLNNPNSGLSNIEKVYIYGRSYDLSNSQKAMILQSVENSSMTYEEKKEFYLTLHNVYEEEDGSVRWK